MASTGTGRPGWAMVVGPPRGDWERGGPTQAVAMNPRAVHWLFGEGRLFPGGHLAAKHEAWAWNISRCGRSRGLSRPGRPGFP